MIDKEKFTTALESEGLSEKTIDLYLIYFNLVNFDLLIKERNQYIYEFVKKYNNGIVRAMLKRLFEYMKTYPDLPDSLYELAKDHKVPKFSGSKKKKEIEAPDRNQVLKLAEVMPTRQLMLMVLTTFFLGLRLVELLTLRFTDVIWDKKLVRIRWEVAKRKKERILPVPDWLIDELIDFIDKMCDSSQRYADNGIIFPMGKVRWERAVKRNAAKIGLPMKVTPHILRHACGSYLDSKGLSIKEIADFLGHASIQTTQGYIHHNKELLNKKVLEAWA